MPPAAFIAAATCSFSTEPATGNLVITFLTPSATAPGDTLLIAAASNDATDGAVDPSKLPRGWSIVATHTTITAQIATLLRRLATDAEPSSHAITFQALTKFVQQMTLPVSGSTAGPPAPGSVPTPAGTTVLNAQ